MVNYRNYFNSKRVDEEIKVQIIILSAIIIKPVIKMISFLSIFFKYRKVILILTRTVRKSDYTPALALPKHIAGILDEKYREKKNTGKNK